jgi:acyl-CoA thioesterase I
MPQTASVPSPEPLPVVVMLGDSLTAGYELPASAALPAAVERALAAKGVAARLVNAGVSGDTTADGLNRFDFSVAGADADLVVIALGANDFLNGLPPAVPMRNLAAILEKTQAAGVPAALVGVSVPEGFPISNAREAEYLAIYPQLAEQFGVPYYADLLGPIAGRPEFLLPDGVHPTAGGVEAMAQPLADFLSPLVEAAEQP